MKFDDTELWLHQIKLHIGIMHSARSLTYVCSVLPVNLGVKKGVFHQTKRWP